MDVVPQLDFSLYPSQVFWFSAAFLSLYFVVRGVVLPKIHKVNAGRVAILDEGVEMSERAYERAQSELLKQKVALERAEMETQRLLEKAQNELDEIRWCVFAMLETELEELYGATEENLERIAQVERENLMGLAAEVAHAYCTAVCGVRKIQKERLRVLVSKVYGGR
ncbi:ATP synthase subunit b [Anaplasma platys]|uniref:ATP synthase subunit b n=1 Tax=Anaplasma platys TaxID=949 RepID=A0A858PZ82_9RICK|nr:hypothetical protein [Anaplasma platys]QJC27858.1 ATP synthase subunit b [Anaplasma platys]